MSVDGRAREAEEAWQALGPGIDLLNVLLADRVLARGQGGSAAWEALKSITLLGRLEGTEEAFADLDRLVHRWEEVGRRAGMPAGRPGAGPVPPNLLEGLRALGRVGELLRSPGPAGPGSDLTGAWNTWHEARRALATPAERRAALESLARDLERRFLGAVGAS